MQDKMKPIKEERMKKNSIIEFMRFIFASIILLFHAGSDAGILNNIYSLGGGRSLLL